MTDLKIEHRFHAKAVKFLGWLLEHMDEERRISFTMQDFCDVIEPDSDSVWEEFFLVTDYLSECHIVSDQSKPVFSEYHFNRHDKATVKLNV